MDREAIRRIQRELDDEARQLFPAGVVRGVAVLQYGEAPVIEPGELLVRVFLDAPGRPETYEQAIDAFVVGHKAAIKEFRGYVVRQLETLDALITGGVAASRAEALSWALDRIRARPAYARLGEPGRDIESLKTEF